MAKVQINKPSIFLSGQDLSRLDWRCSRQGRTANLYERHWLRVICRVLELPSGVQKILQPALAEHASEVREVLDLDDAFGVQAVWEVLDPASGVWCIVDFQAFAFLRFALDDILRLYGDCVRLFGRFSYCVCSDFVVSSFSRAFVVA